MTTVLVLGGGVIGASVAIRLARAGQDVTVLDRDPGPLPADAEEANTSWQRAIGQFQRPHALMPRGYRWFERHAPAVLDELHDLGATPFDMLQDLAPPGLRGHLDAAPDDDRFATLATRRPTLELAVHRVLDREPGVTVHRGARITALLVAAGTSPHRVIGAATDDDVEHRADIVLDAMGRRTSSDTLLRAAGAEPLLVEEVDNDFRYHGRFYRSEDGSIPSIPGMLVPAGTISLLTIPSDNGTWSVVVYSVGDDDELRDLRDPERFDAVVRAHPSHAHLVEGAALTPVVHMVSDAGRKRTLVGDDGPVVHGMLPIGDAWASTNPSYGRGVTLGLLQADVVHDVLAEHAGDLDAVARMWQASIDEQVTPWWQDTVSADTARVRQIRRLRARAAGEPVEQRQPDAVAQFTAAFHAAAGRDADVLRGMVDIACVNALPMEVVARPGLADRVLALASESDRADGSTAGDGRTARRGPTRGELVSLADG